MPIDLLKICRGLNKTSLYPYIQYFAISVFVLNEFNCKFIQQLQKDVYFRHDY